MRFCYIFSPYVITHKHITHIQQNAVHVAEAEPPGIQGVQEGNAQVLFQSRANEAHGRAANAGAVFE